MKFVGLSKYIILLCNSYDLTIIKSSFRIGVDIRIVFIHNYCHSIGHTAACLTAKQFDVYSVVLISIPSLEFSVSYVSDGMS